MTSTPHTLGTKNRRFIEVTADHERTVWLYRAALPAMVLIAIYVEIKKFILGAFGAKPTTNFWLVDGLSRNSRRVREGAARWKALDAVYNFAEPAGVVNLVRRVDKFWMGIRNAQAVRNRLKIARRELASAIERTAARTGRPVRLLSLAAGSAQGVIESVAEFRKMGIEMDVLLIDQGPTALAHARELAVKHEVHDAIMTQEGNVLFFDRLIGGFAPDIVEMLGLLDYLRTGTAILLIKKIMKRLSIGGYFFTCHVHPNSERYFLERVVDWLMIYRTVDEFEGLLSVEEDVGLRLVTEPHGIHTIAVMERVAS